MGEKPIEVPARNSQSSGGGGKEPPPPSSSSSARSGRQGPPKAAATAAATSTTTEAAGPGSSAAQGGGRSRRGGRGRGGGGQGRGGGGAGGGGGSSSAVGGGRGRGKPAGGPNPSDQAPVRSSEGAGDAASSRNGGGRRGDGNRGGETSGSHSNGDRRTPGASSGRAGDSNGGAAQAKDATDGPAGAGKSPAPRNHRSEGRSGGGRGRRNPRSQQKLPPSEVSSAADAQANGTGPTSLGVVEGSAATLQDMVQSNRNQPETNQKKANQGGEAPDATSKGADGQTLGVNEARSKPERDAATPRPPSPLPPVPPSAVAASSSSPPPLASAMSSGVAQSKGTLVLPPPPSSGGAPGIFVLSRSSDAAAPVLTNAVPKAKAKPKQRKKRGDRKGAEKKPLAEQDDEDDEGGKDDREQGGKADVPEPEISVTEAIEKLPAQQVSIDAGTHVKVMRRNNESSASLNEKAAPKEPPKSSSRKKKSGAKKPDGQRLFNASVRQCVEQSDPDGLRVLLRDKKNHHYYLEPSVLETVMVAYVVAAMFDDALYCLRNCARPAALSIHQAEHILSCMPQNLRNSSAYTAADMIAQLCVVTDFDPPTHRSYFLRIVRGISLEFLEEATSARDRICSSPCERLVRTSLCVVDARLERGKKPSEIVVYPGDQLGCFVPDNDQRGIAAGDAVSLLPYAGPYPMSAESLDRNMIEATVINTNPMVLRLHDKLNTSLLAMLTEPSEGNVYRIDKLANRMGFNRQLAAAVAICSPISDSKARDYRRPCPELIKAVTAMDENIVSLMRQSKASVLPKGQQLTSTAALCAEAIPWSVDDEGETFDQDASRAAARLALDKYDVLEGLNASQQLAVEGAMTNRLTLIQGPPGTGKTAVAIRILQHWARLSQASAPKSGVASPILATSDSNIAVDNLVEGCAAVGLRVVRLGRPEAIRPELLKYCIDKPQNSSYGTGDRQRGANSNSYGYGNMGAAGMAQKERLRQLKSAQVICCTCIGSGGDILDQLGSPLEHVLVDEATQATEPAVLVPLMRGCRQLVLVGDHCQLPPTVLSTRAEEEGHGVPLFSRMVACGVPPYMLDTQYRMHPSIAAFPSDLFYGGQLRNGVSSAERRPLAGFPWPREEFPVAFVPVVGDEFDDGVSKFNEAEAAAACDAVIDLLKGGQCSIPDIAVVTPYAAQARLIRRKLRHLLPDNGPPYVEVSSVDGFQGREKEAVVFSAVRSNDYGAIGFTSDWRRVNVSFTRARRALIVIGNEVTLRRGDPETWSPWLAWVDAHGVNMQRPGMPRGRYDPEQLRRVRGGTTAAEMLKAVLERQQAQMKTMEQQQERALKNARGQTLDESNLFNGSYAAQAPANETPTIEKDLALMENADGNWDDSDEDDDDVLHHSVSRATLNSACSSYDVQSGDETGTAVDIWDL